MVAKAKPASAFFFIVLIMEIWVGFRVQRLGGH